MSEIRPGEYETSISDTAHGVAETSFLQEQADLIADFWSPVIEEQSELLDRYWSPIIEEQSSLVGNYWGETWNEWEPGLCRAAQWYDETVLETLRTPVNHVRTRFADEVSAVENAAEQAVIGVKWAHESQDRLIGNYWRPILEDQENLISNYWKKATPTLYGIFQDASDAVGLIGAVPRIGMSMYANWSMANMDKIAESSKDHALPGGIKNQVDYIADTMKESQNGASIGRAEAGLFRMARFSSDRGMQQCYHVQVLDSPEINALNTGCTIYVTQGALDALPNDDELDAVIAHEISHGDAGHAIQNVGWEFLLPVIHTGKIIWGGVVWGWTGEVTPRLNQVLKEGHLEVLLEDYANLAPPVEIEADKGATEILLRAGKSPDHLRRAMIRLHGYDPEVVMDGKEEFQSDTGSGSDGKVRKYPGLSDRLIAIDEAESKYSYLKRL